MQPPRPQTGAVFFWGLQRSQPLASPEFIRAHALNEPADLLRVPLIQSSVSVAQWPDWFARFGGQLQPVFEDPLSLEVQAHFMVYPARHASRPEVKCFAEWLQEEAGG